MDNPEKGAMTSIYLATSPEVEGMSGNFFGNRNNLEQPDEKYYSLQNEQKVWDYYMEIVNKYL